MDEKLARWRERLADRTPQVVALRWLLERLPWRDVELYAIDATNGRKDSARGVDDRARYAFKLVKELGAQRGVWPMPARRTASA